MAQMSIISINLIQKPRVCDSFLFSLFQEPVSRTLKDTQWAYPIMVLSFQCLGRRHPD